MATDKLFYDYTRHFPDTMAKLVHAEADEYEAKSITFKEIEKRSDLFLIGRSGKHVVLVETQGYRRKNLFHDMVMTMMLYSTHNKYWHGMDAAAVFLDESHLRAAQQRFERQFQNTSVLKFSPKVFVFSRIGVEELARQGDIHLIPLYPLCRISPTEIKARAPEWAEQIKTDPDLKIDERENLLTFLAGAISHRIKTITKESIDKLFGGFKMEDTPIFQRIAREEYKRGIHQVLFRLIDTRFGMIPDDLRQKIRTIDGTEELEKIATELLTVQTLEELKSLVH